MENIKAKLKEAIKEEVAKIQIDFPQREEWQDEEDYEEERMDTLHDVRDNHDWSVIMEMKEVKDDFTYDDFIYEEIWEELLKLL